MTSEAPKRRNTGLIVVLIVIAVLLLFCCALAALAALIYPWMSVQRGPASLLDIPRAGGVEATRELDRAFQVSDRVVLDVSNQVGDVIIEGTDDGQVIVEALVRAYGATTTDAERIADEVELTMEQRADDRIRVIGRYRRGLEFQGRSPSVGFMIRVPRDTTVRVSSDVGRVEVTDVDGSAAITSNVGDVIVREFTMRDDTRIEASVGRILVELPADSAFVVDAETNVGDIDTEFEVRGAAPQRVPPGDRLQGEVGDNPQVELRLRTSTGDITIAAD
jgi:hypothetical protein